MTFSALSGRKDVYKRQSQWRDDMAAQVVSEVNAERAKYGLSPVTVSAELTEAARVRAQELTESFSRCV